MKTLKTTLPALLIAVASVLLYFYQSQLPQSVQQTMSLMPFLLTGTLVLFALFFNQGHLFYLALACFFSWLLFNYLSITDSLLIELCFIVLVLLVFFAGVLTEKGLLTLAAWKIHLLSLMLLGLAYGSWIRQTPWLSTWVNSNWLPLTWFQWIELSQFSLFTTVILLTCLLYLYWWRQHEKSLSAGFILITVLLLFLWHENFMATTLACCSGLLILLIRTLQQSWHLAYMDELTGLPGRRALEERLQRSLGIYALAMVDVDHFKKFNDTYGHDVGDDVLRMIAAKIGKVNGGGKAYRYGGEEFTVVFSNHSSDEVKFYLQELIDVVAATPFVVNRRKNQKPKKVQVTISIGLTDSIDKATANETIKTADDALYAAKKKGRNRLSVKS